MKKKREDRGSKIKIYGGIRERNACILVSEESEEWCFCFVGTCSPTSIKTFLCHCTPGWWDNRCQTMNNYCQKDTCFHDGVCQPLHLNYTCRCLTDSYSGRHCEIVGNGLLTRQIISKSFAYVAIIAVTSVALFVIVMDILKYCFGIDPVGPTRKKLRSMKTKRRKKRKKPVTIIRYIYTP